MTKAKWEKREVSRRQACETREWREQLSWPSAQCFEHEHHWLCVSDVGATTKIASCPCGHIVACSFSRCPRGIARPLMKCQRDFVAKALMLPQWPKNLAYTFFLTCSTGKQTQLNCPSPHSTSRKCPQNCYEAKVLYFTKPWEIICVYMRLPRNRNRPLLYTETMVRHLSPKLIYTFLRIRKCRQIETTWCVWDARKVQSDSVYVPILP